MFTREETKNEIREKIQNAIGDVIGEYQDKYEMAGDIEPFQAVAYDKTILDLTNIVADVLQYEYIWNRRTAIIDVYASDANRIESICEKTDLFQHSLIAILLDAVEAGEIDLDKYM